MGSAAVIASGALIMLYDWRLADPIATVLIAGYILWHALSEIGGAIRILMLGSPEGADIDALAEAFRGVDGVADIHHIHLWRLQEDMTALDAHVVLEAGRWGEADAIKGRLKALVAERFSVRHATLELECARHACADARLVGHG
jgi:cobalt-zinc-cadmium efflux system protein